MVKGVNKQMIMLKLENNRLYESVCFILRTDVERKKQEERDMLGEANRILAEMDIKKPKHNGRGGFRRFVWSVAMLVIGAAVGFGAAFLV